MMSHLKSIAISLVVILIFNMKMLNAQPITIHNTDMPVKNDTIRLSIASPLTAGIDLSITGADTTWDFSQLVPDSQTVDSFFAISSTGAIYYLAFGPIGANSSFASRGPDVSASTALSNVYNFYKLSTTMYQQNGLGATLSGIQTPLSFTSNDVIYKFPLNYNDKDTSHAVYGIAVTGTGSYDATQTRINHVDGWGKVITPYGTFNCLRMKSELTGHDSINITTPPQVISVDRPLTREYKWLAIGKKVPVLQINTQEILPGNEIITSIVYRDSARVLTSGMTELADHILINAYPNPVHDILNFQIFLKEPTKVQYELISSSGQRVYSCNDHLSAGATNKNILVTPYQTGIYLLRIVTEKGNYNKRIIISGK